MPQVIDDSTDCWLSPPPPPPPPHFLSHHTAPVKMSGVVHSDLDFAKQKFPYDFGLLKSELTYPVDSQSTSESEEEAFFGDLNRRLTIYESRKVTPVNLRQSLEVPKVLGGSPQSILGGIGSWSGRSSNESHQSPLHGPSPPSSEAEHDTAGLIYAAARQVERLKMCAEGTLNTNLNVHVRVASNTKSELDRLPPDPIQIATDIIAEQNYLAASIRAYNAALLYEHHLQNLNNSMRQTRSMMTRQFTQSPWQHRVSTKHNFQSAPLQRKESVGTGVFLPRRYNTAPSVPQRKMAANLNTTAIAPVKVVQALNMSFKEMNSRPLSQKSHEALMARRNALAQQQRSIVRAVDLAQAKLGVCLPQEWSY